jgi:N-methylhydantoinase A
VNLRLSAVGRLAPLDLRHSTPPVAATTPPRAREAYFKETGVVRCDVVAREALAPDWSRPGPLIVESPDTTVVIPPGWRLSVEAGGLIALERTHA